jgi:hypothetical protein
VQFQHRFENVLKDFQQACAAARSIIGGSRIAWSRRLPRLVASVERVTAGIRPDRRTEGASYAWARQACGSQAQPGGPPASPGPNADRWQRSYVLTAARMPQAKRLPDRAWSTAETPDPRRSEGRRVRCTPACRPTLKARPTQLKCALSFVFSSAKRRCQQRCRIFRAAPRRHLGGTSQPAGGDHAASAR